jgi:hypothetical protein
MAMKFYGLIVVVFSLNLSLFAMDYRGMGSAISTLATMTKSPKATVSEIEQFINSWSLSDDEKTIIKEIVNYHRKISVGSSLKKDLLAVPDKPKIPSLVAYALCMKDSANHGNLLEAVQHIINDDFYPLIIKQEVKALALQNKNLSESSKAALIALKI